MRYLLRSFSTCNASSRFPRLTYPTTHHGQSLLPLPPHFTTFLDPSTHPTRPLPSSPPLTSGLLPSASSLRVPVRATLPSRSAHPLRPAAVLLPCHGGYQVLIPVYEHTDSSTPRRDTRESIATFSSIFLLLHSTLPKPRPRASGRMRRPPLGLARDQRRNQQCLPRRARQRARQPIICHE